MLYIFKIKNLIASYFLLLAVALTVTACGGGSSQAEHNSLDEAAAVPPIGAAIGNIDASSPQNLAPDIRSISLGCDLYLEVIAVNLSDVASFSLDVNDESPGTLTYFVSSDDSRVLESTVDSNGLFNLRALSIGSTTVLVQVIDEVGNKDEILVNVVVNS